MLKRFSLPIVAVFAVMLANAPSSSAAPFSGEALSDEAGWHCTADASRAGWTLLASPQAGSPYSPLVKQSRGVITSWNVRVGPGLNPLAQQLGVFRPINGGSEYTKVAESAIETFGTGSEQRPTRIPVQAGDFVGLHGPLGTFVCDEGENATSALFEGGIALSETKAFKTESGVRSPVGAIVESDADGDGYGDASQDRCPESALFQASCPLVALSIGEVTVKRSAILIEAGNNTEASLTARGEVRWQARPKAGGGAAHLSKGHQVRVGLDTVAPKTVMPGATVVLRVPLPKPALAQLDRLLPRQALQARIDVVGTNLVPYTGTHELKIRLPGRAKPKQAR
jgi:hypothetical protein